MESLRKSGLGGAKMFTKDDLAGMNSDEMADMVRME